MEKPKMRVERDSMGEMEVPEDALFGAQTARAVENFPISGRPLPVELIHTLARIKRHAAGVNVELGLLDREVGGAIAAAAQEVEAGRWDAEFPVDVFQTGSGTSSNMNANEVIARLASRRLGGDARVHPNDHVNLGQSSNDVFPTAIHITAMEGIARGVLPGLEELEAALSIKAEAFHGVLKLGRTHLQDAVPMRLGQTFGGYARMTALARERIAAVLPRLGELALGGTAVGTGLNTHPEFARRVIARLAVERGVELREAVDHFEAQGSRDACLETSAALRSAGISLMKMANDIRFLGSGPRCGLGELKLAPTQPGSSIMPGKVNPVMCEMVMQVGVQITGNDAAIALANSHGNFELNVMMPVIARNLLESITLLGRASSVFARRCIVPLEADAARCAGFIEQSLAMCTALAPRLGYDAAAAIAKEAWATNRTVREVAGEVSGLSAAELEALLDPAKQAGG